MVWHKTNPAPKIYKAGFLNSCELVVCMWDKGHTWNFISQKEMHNFVESPICMGAERVKHPFHPTQKTIKVLRHIIRIATNPNDIVFDPFMGVGSTGVATLQMDRKFIGFEIDEKYFKAAEKRLETVQPNLLGLTGYKVETKNQFQEIVKEKKSRYRIKKSKNKRAVKKIIGRRKNNSNG